MFDGYNNKPIDRPSSNQGFISEDEKRELQFLVVRRIRLTKEYQERMHIEYQAQQVGKK